MCLLCQDIYIHVHPKNTDKKPELEKKTEIPVTCSICFMTTHLIRLQKMIGGIEYHFYYQVHIQ